MFIDRVLHAQENVGRATNAQELILAVGAYGVIVSRAVSDRIADPIGLGIRCLYQLRGLNVFFAK